MKSNVRGSLSIYTNVRKKGRPVFLHADDVKLFQRMLPGRSYRQCCDARKYACVWKVLLQAAGDGKAASAMGYDAAVCRPKAFQRFPSLMGEKVQHTVLAEMYGMNDEDLIKTADDLENLHRDGFTNAQMARKIVRRERQRCIFIACCDALDAVAAVEFR